MILALAEIMSVRVVGDPLQAVFALLDHEEYCQWRDVEAAFSLVTELNTPHRWVGYNDALGRWLTGLRRQLIEGADIDLRNSPVIFKHVTGQKDQARLNACFTIKSQKEHSMVALRKWRPECHRLARNLKGRFRAMETVECDELLDWSQRIEAAAGASRVIAVLEFADACMSGLPIAVKQFGERLAEGKPPKPQRADYKAILKSLEAVRDTSDLQSVLASMVALTAMDNTLVIGRHELWREMKRALKEHKAKPTSSLRQTAWNLRNRLRHLGSNVDRASLATPLLVKGLEFDHALVLDPNDHEDAENLYVAMTRGSRSLTIVSDTPVLRRPKPRYLRNGESGTSSES